MPGNNDREFMGRIVARLPQYRDRIVLLEDYDAQQLKWIISNFVAFAGCRMHATVAALSSCVPTISIGYSMKARGLNRDIFGHLDWLMPIEQMEPKLFADKVCRLVKEAGEVRRNLQELMPGYRQRAVQAAVYLREVVEMPRPVSVSKRNIGMDVLMAATLCGSCCG
jgi:colanic acid/amylovoran biosynthesis protein